MASEGGPVGEPGLKYSGRCRVCFGLVLLFQAPDSFPQNTQSIVKA